jgi:hypothetical protein
MLDVDPAPLCPLPERPMVGFEDRKSCVLDCHRMRITYGFQVVNDDLNCVDGSIDRIEKRPLIGQRQKRSPMMGIVIHSRRESMPSRVHINDPSSIKMTKLVASIRDILQ